MTSALAIAAHPDDIEFVMAGTMLRLKSQGWELHYFNLANGCRGSMTMDRETCAATRLRESRRAAETLGAQFYPPICADMEISYGMEQISKVAAVIRIAKPSIILTHSPVDYMEDHEAACRLAVSAAFAHGMPNLVSQPPVEPYFDPVTVYHAQPHGNHTPLGELVRPHFAVDTTDLMHQKLAALECHACQKEWLDQSQGMNSYVETMRELSRQVGAMTGRFEYAEGWRKRQHLGFCEPGDDPLRTALSPHIAELQTGP